MFIFLLFASLLLIINVDFIAYIYIIVYIGAISIFFLFAIMLLDLRADELNLNKDKYLMFKCLPFIIIDDIFTLIHLNIKIDQIQFFHIIFERYNNFHNVITDLYYLIESYIYKIDPSLRIQVEYLIDDLSLIGQTSDFRFKFFEISSKILYHAYDEIDQIEFTDLRRDTMLLQSQDINSLFFKFNELIQVKPVIDVITIGQLFFTEYAIIVFLLGLLLFLSLLGIILLTFEYSKSFIKKQQLSLQVRSKISTSLLLTSKR
jgi:NADH:ubiquinone oxidoreductase subunit 6 (subunit J)